MVLSILAWLCSCSSSTAHSGPNTGGTGGTDQSTSDALGGGDEGSGSFQGAGGAQTDGGTAAAGGTTASVLDAACAKICTVATQQSCVNPTFCFYLCAFYTPPTDTSDPTYAPMLQQYTDMMSCIAENLTSVSDYICSTGGSLNAWSIKADTVCEALACAWTCFDSTFGDGNVYVRCGCYPPIP